MTLFRNKYRIESTRLPGWDYGQAGHYFVTICTEHRAHFFGRVLIADVKLSDMGEIVADEWAKTSMIRPNVKLDEWIIMPNHMHAIVVLTHKIVSNECIEETPRRGVSTGRDTQTGLVTAVASEKWGANTLGSIIGQFKGKCTKRIRGQGGATFAWQPRFYDRIIRSQEALYRVRRYIASNPMNWAQDRHHAAGLWM